MKLTEKIMLTMFVICILLGVCGYFVMDYFAFKQMFPDAGLFAYLMRG